MKFRTLVFFAVIVSLMALGFLTFTILNRGAQGQERPPKRYTEMPQVISTVKNLEILDTWLEEEGTPHVRVMIKIRNNSDKAITHVAIVSGDDKSYSGTTFGNEAGALIEPNGTYEIDFSIANLHPPFPIRIGGVNYADNTEDGDEATLGAMRGQKEHDERERKGEPQPQ